MKNLSESSRKKVFVYSFNEADKLKWPGMRLPLPIGMASIHTVAHTHVASTRYDFKL